MLLVLQIIACARQNSFEAGSFAAWRETRYAAAIMSDRVGGRGGGGWEGLWGGLTRHDEAL